MSLKFIFMLTRNDQTVKNAEEYLETVLNCGVKHIGFKDIGLPFEKLKILNEKIKKYGAESYLEVVSLDKDSEMLSAQTAVDIGVDNLLGGTNIQPVLPIIKGSKIRYFPFPGEIVGHPSVLSGSIEKIVKSSSKLVGYEGVHGLDLLAYRFAGDVFSLMKAVSSITDKPVIIAGSIDSKKKIIEVMKSGAQAFTIGTAALDGVYTSKGNNLNAQLSKIIEDVTEINAKDL
ncbi:MAG: 4-hydroxythreonine-4-phosphate dehydrogenase [Rhodobacteraceae bacterium]|nr:4-hydroxythreonine-4-phosphate dehydrogenase [Paracoccaceae bacterium]